MNMREGGVGPWQGVKRSKTVWALGPSCIQSQTNQGRRISWNKEKQKKRLCRKAQSQQRDSPNSDIAFWNINIIASTISARGGAFIKLCVLQHNSVSSIAFVRQGFSIVLFIFFAFDSRIMIDIIHGITFRNQRFNSNDSSLTNSTTNN